MLSSKILRLASTRSALSKSAKFSKDQVYKSSPTFWINREVKRVVPNILIWAGGISVCLGWPFAIQYLTGHGL